MTISTELFMEAERAIQVAITTHPFLAARGFGDQPRNDLSVEGVATALAFLRNCCRVTRIPKWSSYGIKHAAEQWGRKYGFEPFVANGEAIAAAVYLSIPLKRLNNDDPNALIAVDTVRTNG